MIELQAGKKEVPERSETSMPAKRTGEKSSKVRKSVTDTTHVLAILGTMMSDQREHKCAQFGEAYFTYRKVVAGWIMDVGEYFSLHPTTTHSAVAYLDRLHLSGFSRHEWQMLAISCILIAAKYNEREEDVPDLLTIEDIAKQPIPNDILLKYELWTLQKMGWKLTVHTPLAFLACYVVCGVCHSGDACSRPTSTSFSTAQALLLPSSGLYEMDAEITKGCYALASFSLLEVSLKPYRASDIACAILYYVRRSLSITPVWSKELLLLTKTAPDDEGFSIVLEILEDLIPSPSPSSSTCGTPEESLVPADAGDQSTSQSETVSHPPVTPTATVRTHDRDTDVTDNLVASFSAATFSPPSTPSDPLNSNEGPRSSSVVFTPADDKENAFKGEPVPSPISVVSMGVLEGV